MLRSCEKSILRKKNPVLPLRNFRLLYYPGILQRLQHLIIQFPARYYLLVIAYGRLITKENFKLLALKVVAVAYETWSLARGSQCSDLAKKTFGILENWSLMRGGRNRRFNCSSSSIQFVGRSENFFHYKPRLSVFSETCHLLFRENLPIPAWKSTAL